MTYSKLLDEIYVSVVIFFIPNIFPTIIATYGNLSSLLLLPMHDSIMNRLYIWSQVLAAVNRIH